MAAWPEMNAQAAREALRQAACRAGLDVDPNCGVLGITRTIESGWTSGASKPRNRPQPGVEARKPAIVGSPLIWGNQIKVRKVEWLWPSRIPVGKMTTFAGQTVWAKRSRL